VEQGLFSRVQVFMKMITPKVMLRLVAEIDPAAARMSHVIINPVNKRF